MLSDLLFWLSVAAYVLVGGVAARKHRETHDRGFIWLVLAFVLPAILVMIAQGCEFVLWANSPALPQIVASFDTVRSIVQALGLAAGMYMIGGRPREHNLWRWLFDEPTDVSTVGAQHP